MLRTARFLFWLGVFVVVFEVIGVLLNIGHAIAVHQFAIYGSAWISILFGPIYQGGTLIGLGKILETLHAKRGGM